LNISYL